MAMRAAGCRTGTRETPVCRVYDGRMDPGALDRIAVEEPLEIQLGYGGGTREVRTLSVTMRTPGYDRELAAGCLFAEGVIGDPAHIATILERRNTIRVELDPLVAVDWPRLERHCLTSSSCGVCGKTSIEAAGHRHSAGLPEGPVISARLLPTMPARLRAAQSAFEDTGGLHAAALFSAEGELVALYEDVGRHNAADKLIGAEFLAGRLPLHRSILLLSGRASFELTQKAIAAGIPIVAAIGAPSSLAIDLAQEAGLTLAGFLRDGRFNIYAGLSRVAEAP